MSKLSNLLKARLEEVGTTKYKLAKAMAEADGQGKPVTSFSAKVSKTLANPEARVFENVQKLVELLDGEIVIRWRSVREHTLKD